MNIHHYIDYDERDNFFDRSVYTQMISDVDIQTLRNLLPPPLMNSSIKPLCISEMLKEKNMLFSVSKYISTILEDLKMNSQKRLSDRTGNNTIHRLY